MSKENIIDYKEEAALAVAEEKKAKTQPEEGVYIHKFEKPFTYNDNTVTELTFDWDALTGGDYDAIEEELVRKGIWPIWQYGPAPRGTQMGFAL